MVRSKLAPIVLGVSMLFPVSVGFSRSKLPRIPDRITPTQLRCEYAIDPLGVDVKQPRFSWLLESSQRGQMQSGFHILVASSKEKLAAGIGDKWDSLKVTSGNSVNITYEGRTLSSGEKCCWKVRCWDKDGKASPWSAPAWFEMGLLKQSDWQGEWIGAERNVSSPLLRKEFEIPKKVKQARVYISGLGWSELYFNGRKVGDNVLDPAATEYHKHTLYVTHDVTDMLNKGANAAGVMLGNGWFSEPGMPVYGDSPRLLMQVNIEFTDGTGMNIKTDRTWKVCSGPITRNDIWGGETYDARLEKNGWAKSGYDDSAWADALVKEKTGGQMVSQLMPAIKVNQTIRPVKLTGPEPGIYVYDMGQLFGGWARLHVKGPKGTKVTIKYSARVFKDSGLLDKRRHRRGNETDYYILKGDRQGEVYEPRFTYHPVRYVQIEGYPGEPTLDDLQGRVVHSAINMSGHFQCSNPLLNKIHQNVVWTFTNGLFGIPLDCLHREHWAWTDPATITGSLYPRKFMPLFWTKWLRDIKDSQFDDGAVPVIAPTYRIEGHRKKNRVDAAWGGNYPLLVWYVHEYYNDNRILREHYDSIKKWLDYLTCTADDHLVTKGVYGDHMLPGAEPGKEQFISKETPRPLVWTAYYYRGAYVFSQMAKILGKSDDAEHYAALAENIADAFNRKWLNTETSQYATGSQTSNLLPLALGIVPKADKEVVMQSVLRDIMEKHAGHLHTGNSGTTCMIDTLTEHGHGDVMYEVATKTTYPGWGYMVAQGATTIWEMWGLGKGAESMIMWATIDEFFYENLAGIRGPDYYGPGCMEGGFRQIEIKPYILGDLKNAKASVKTVQGIVSSEWEKDDRCLALAVVIPVNSRAKVAIPTMALQNVTITEGGKSVWKADGFVKGVPGITAGSKAGQYVTFDVGSGSYSFRLTRE